MTCASDLVLYHAPGCPYCTRVTSVLRELGVELEQRNVRQNMDYRAELVGARGRATVPVLRIDRDDGSREWMPESLDIVRYLRSRFAGGG